MQHNNLHKRLHAISIGWHSARWDCCGLKVPGAVLRREGAAHVHTLQLLRDRAVRAVENGRRVPITRSLARFGSACYLSSTQAHLAQIFKEEGLQTGKAQLHVYAGSPDVADVDDQREMLGQRGQLAVRCIEVFGLVVGRRVVIVLEYGQK